MSHFDEYINDLTNSIPTEDLPSICNALVTEAKITTQKIQEHTKHILFFLGERDYSFRIGKLILICARLECVNRKLAEIRHEYNL